jgi:hypothetical protein
MTTSVQTSRRTERVNRAAAVIVESDPTLPDEIIIPRELANNIASLTACIDAQRIGQRGCVQETPERDSSLSDQALFYGFDSGTLKD